MYLALWASSHVWEWVIFMVALFCVLSELLMWWRGGRRW